MTNTKARIFRTLLWVVGGLITIICFAYLTDFAILRWKFKNKRDPFATVKINPYYAVPRKDHRIEYMFEEPTEETCVNSLFPHGGSSPCWYLTRHRERRVDL
ncbi:MAG: hypothetical protein ACJ74Y_00605 [Bryobacteraceae bacterium]